MSYSAIRYILLFYEFTNPCHSGTCGQIFDAKCTSLISGKQFGQSGTLRVCKPCEGIINGYDDSSDFSDDGSVQMHGRRPRHGSTASEISTGISPLKHGPTAKKQPPRLAGYTDLTVPTMAIPATRRAGNESNRKPAILEIEGERTLARPTSSRSLRSAFGSRPLSSYHKRQYSRLHMQRGFKPASDDLAPFQRTHSDEKSIQDQLPAFHDDNIIDPDLAAFMSEEDSSGDEQVSIMTAMHGNGMGRSLDNESSSFAGILASSKKSRNKGGEKSLNNQFVNGRDIDAYSLSSSKAANFSRSHKRRNLSVSSNIHLRASPRSYRGGLATPLSTRMQESFSSSALARLDSPGTPVGGLRTIRSSSMKGADAPAIELNNASMHHVRKLLHQLLQCARITNAASWEKALIPILLQTTDDVSPDIHHGDDIDIRHYVKLKKIPGGRPGDTLYVSGLVFTKNLALKSMPRSIAHPNILILTFPLEYARHHQHFMSLEPVIRQEREYLQNLVNRIAALRPQLLLVQRNVSGLALQFLEQANIATAYNVKPSVIEAVSRCSQTRIISSIDKLAVKPAQAGRCTSFYLKTYVHDGKKKTYMYVSGCPKELGCTIVLRGADHKTLAEMKRITEFMIYVVYNLKLETCLMRDEFALIPSCAEGGSLPQERNSTARTDGTSCVGSSPLLDGMSKASHRLSHSEDDIGHAFKTSLKMSIASPIKAPELTARPAVAEPRLSDDLQMPDDVPMPTFYADMVEEHKNKILSGSPFVSFMQPYLLMRAREYERRLIYLKRLRDQAVSKEVDIEETGKTEASRIQKFDLIKPEMIHETLIGASRKVREVLYAVHDAEYDKALHHYQTQKKQWETYISGNINLFDPYAHQSITVLYSVVCTISTVPCSGPDLLALGFYNEHETGADFEADCTLGQYVEDLCFGSNTVCTANGCERRMFDHHRQYVHGEAQLSVFVQPYPCKLRGLQDTILMWSCCRLCGKETQVMPMSDNTWRYSFGKYLELSFWSRDLHARADVCPHDLHRNHLRYFGFKDVAVRVHYDPISLLEIIVPRSRITWKVDNDLKFRNEIFLKTQERINRFMLSVKARIKSLKVDSVVPEKVDTCKLEIEKLTKRANEEHNALIRKLQDKYMDSRYYEVVPFNRAVRATQEKVAEWDTAFAKFDHDFFPSEKDIRRLATLQLKRIFLDKDESMISLDSAEEATSTSISEGDLGEKTTPEDTPTLNPQLRAMSPEKAHDVLTSVMKEHSQEGDEDKYGLPDHTESAPATSVPFTTSEALKIPLKVSERKDVRHLDLAVPSSMLETTVTDLVPLVSETHLNLATASKESHAKGDEINHKLHSGDTIEEPVSAIKSDVENATMNSKEETTATQGHISAIPRLHDRTFRHVGIHASPILQRAHSGPAHLRRGKANSRSSISPNLPQTLVSHNINKVHAEQGFQSDDPPKSIEKKLPDRLGLSTLKPTGVSTHSKIPRSITSRHNESKVSALAKHFEQLSREFEKERLRERRQRAALNRQSRAYPVAASKPIVEVYRNVHDAVEEREPSDEDLPASEPSRKDHQHSPAIPLEQDASATSGHGTRPDDTTAENTETDEYTHRNSTNGSDTEGDGNRSEEDHSLEDSRTTDEVEDRQTLPTSDLQLDLKLDLPRHEKTSLMKMLTNFWAERSASGWQALDYPLNASDHIFADSDIIIREDEPSSLIAFALGSQDYQAKLGSIVEKSKNTGATPDIARSQEPEVDTDEQVDMERSLLRSTGTHLKYQFQEGSAKMLCKIFYSEQFDAVRRKCGVSERTVDSLSRCLKWDSKGGKTKSVFLKTLDDRFVLKSLSQIETQAFLRFAPAYFQIMSEALFHDLPSVIAKMLGFYQIVIKNPVTGVDFNWFLLVMENLFYDRSPTRIFDLKGSMRNRRIQSTGEQNEVLLDENMVEFIYESPLFVREHSKKLLRASVWNDTLFLARQNVMDYSLMIAIDENKKELVVGIIDCIRTYTWDKKLESWIKDRGKNRPTVTSPKEYKSRFREAMGRYVLQAPK